MSSKHMILAALAVFAFATPAISGEMKPMSAESIDLGTMSGVAYYTVEAEGYHVVATLAHRDSGAPIRLEAVLSSGQTLTLSTPRDAGQAPLRVEISRVADAVRVSEAMATN
jgi:hypothetical protein